MRPMSIVQGRSIAAPYRRRDGTDVNGWTLEADGAGSRRPRESCPPMCRTRSSRSPALPTRRAPASFSLVINRFVWETAARRPRQLLSAAAPSCASSGSMPCAPPGFDRKTRRRFCRCWRSTSSRRARGRKERSSWRLSGGASIMLDVECIEVQLADTGGAWETGFKPRHPGGPVEPIRILPESSSSKREGRFPLAIRLDHCLRISKSGLQPF